MKFLINQIQHTSAMPNAVGSNKIEVVAAVVSILFLGIVAFLIFVERKLNKIEKQLNK
ncbi:MAG: CcmD family protein [Bacteroidia bacterium]